MDEIQSVTVAWKIFIVTLNVNIFNRERTMTFTMAKNVVYKQCNVKHAFKAKLLLVSIFKYMTIWCHRLQACFYIYWGLSMYYIIWVRGIYSYTFCHEFRKMLQTHVFGGTPRLLQNYIAGSKKLSHHFQTMMHCKCWKMWQ